MPPTRRTDAPLSGAKLSRRRPLPATAPDAPLTLNHGHLHVPPGADARLVPVPGRADTYRVAVTYPGPLPDPPTRETIPAELLTAASVGAPSATQGPGHRPPHLAAEFVPSLGDSLAARAQRQPSSAIPTAIFGADERELLTNARFPWSAVGRIDTPCGTGTGCAIGPRLLLTANHLIAWNDDGTAGWLRFRPAYDLGVAPFGEAWATRVLAWFATAPADGMLAHEVAFDYAVCVLDAPIGALVGYPGYRTYDRTWNGARCWQHLSYPSDLVASQRLAYQDDLYIATVGEQHIAGQLGYVLGHFGDIVPGHSGGPLWGWWPDDPWPTIVGLQSSQSATPAPTPEGDNECCGGPALTTLLAYARERYG